MGCGAVRGPCKKKSFKPDETSLALGVSAVTVIYVVLFLLLFAVVTRWVVLPRPLIKPQSPRRDKTVKPASAKTAA
jgi:hypothetical protein